MPEMNKRRRMTVRTRLALSYAALVTVCGAVLIAIVVIFMGVVPSYSFGGQSLQIELGSEVALNSEAPIQVTTQDDMLRVLLTVSIVVLAVLAIVTAGIAWALAGRMLRPLADVNNAAKRAAAGELDHRISASGPRDEISELADTFDTMLDEIERSVEAHRRFAANASHELRTPLATARTMLDVALAGQQSGALPDRELLSRLREVNERSVETVEALLDLAEIEAAGPQATGEAVDLRCVVADEVARCAELARAEGVTVEFATAAPDHAGVGDAPPVRGSSVLLRQLVQNLLQNAVQHNEVGGGVNIVVERSDHDVALRVSNTGVPVTSAELDRLLEPFERGEGRVGGARRGLGLSIVRAIVAHHGGQLRLWPRDGGGLSVEVLLPVE